MLGWYARLGSFSDKVSWLVTLTSALAIVSVSAAFAAVNHVNLKSATFATLKAQTDIAALNSGAPLVFGDRATANEVLGAFQALPNVNSATLYTLDGVAFARYRRDGAARTEAGLPPLGFNPLGKRLVSVTTVQERGQPLGRLRVVFDLSELRWQLWRNVLLAVSVSLLAIALAFALSRRLASVITRPIGVLTRTARRVSETRDYSLRVIGRAGDDEIGAFTGTFNEMLAQIERQDRDLKASREQAEVASRMKDEFLATLSHELRTPMTPILGWAQILRRSAQQPQILQAAEVIERNALAQTRIIDDLLDMSRIVSGKVRLDMQTFQMGEVVDAALEAVRDAADGRDIAIETSIADDVPLVRGDPHRIQQVLWNLLSNAIKFTPHGGSVRIAVRRVDADAGRAYGHRTGNDIEIEVGDSGQGIAAEFLPHVFERFRQADSSVTRHHGGLGLGLAIVKQIVELHGGDIAVASAGVGTGATFTVRLPIRKDAQVHARVTQQPATAADRRSPLGTLPLRDLRLLVVDDEADAREWIGQVLGQSGAQVCLASSAAEALERLPRFQPHLLVSDIGMPGTDGYALIRQIRTLPPALGGELPAIAITAFARNDDRARALGAGYQLHLGKPLDQEELIAAVASIAGAPSATEQSGDATDDA